MQPIRHGAARGGVAAPKTPPPARGPFDFPRTVEDASARRHAVELARSNRIVLPTFAEMADPRLVPAAMLERLTSVGPDEAHPANLFRVHWFNGLDRRRRVDVPVHVELPESLTGVKARIVVALGALFPMIATHKVLAAYACLAPRLVSGRFDATLHRAVWPSTGNYCRGGIAISRILGCRGVAVLPEGMSAERFEWLSRWVNRDGDVIRTPGTESSVKEIYDRCAQLARDPANDIVNQFSEFGNYLVHYYCSGPAFARVFEHLRASTPAARLSAYVSASGSAGTLGAGDFLKEQHGARIAVVEALECPTLLMNGYGEHNIQGIGDKHVPLIHNVMNTDFVIGVTDQATDGLNTVFNRPEGQAYVARRLGVAHDVLQSLGFFGLSSLANMLGAIKLAKHLDLGPDDVLMTVATDSADMYRSELQRYLRRRHNMGELTEEVAGEICRTYLAGADTEHVLEASARERERIFNLGYFTWVEQQGVSVADFDKRRSQTFWHELHDLVPVWDEMITAFNHDVGAGGAR